MRNEISIVAIGGGHGLGKVLQAFADYRSCLTGIVATTDNGGSTGELRKAKDSIAWGDLRNCLVHLANSETIGHKLLNYRFDMPELHKHNLGNLIFYALEDMAFKPVEIIEVARRLLKVESRLFPMTETPSDLLAKFADGSQVQGEVQIDNTTNMPSQLLLTEQVNAPSKALRAINSANFILLGPGSFLTSIVPSLLVEDIRKAIVNSGAKLIFIDNLGKENSAAGTLSLTQRLNWLEQLCPEIGIDAVLSAPSINLDKPNILHVRKAMNEGEVFYRHDAQKLRAAIEEVMLKLS